MSATEEKMAKETDSWQLVAALRGHAQWIRNYRRAPRKYFKPDGDPKLLDEAADRLEELSNWEKGEDMRRFLRS